MGRHEAGHRRLGPGPRGRGTPVGRAGQASAFEAESRGPIVREPAWAVHIRAGLLHINCFYDGNCEPEHEMADLIRATILYIDLAERLSEE